MNQPFVSGTFTFKVYISYSWCDDKLQCEKNPHCFIPDHLNPKVVCDDQVSCYSSSSKIIYLRSFIYRDFTLFIIEKEFNQTKIVWLYSEMLLLVIIHVTPFTIILKSPDSERQSICR